jgi:hypothetical protein
MLDMPLNEGLIDETPCRIGLRHVGLGEAPHILAGDKALKTQALRGEPRLLGP